MFDAYGNPLASGPYGPTGARFTHLVAVITGGGRTATLSTVVTTAAAATLAYSATAGGFVGSVSAAIGKAAGSYKLQAYANTGGAASGPVAWDATTTGLLPTATYAGGFLSFAYVGGALVADATHFKAWGIFADAGVAQYAAGQTIQIFTSSLDACGGPLSSSVVSAASTSGLVTVSYTLDPVDTTTAPTATVGANPQPDFGLASDGSVKSFQPSFSVTVAGAYRVTLTAGTGSNKFKIYLPSDSTTFQVGPGAVSATLSSAALGTTSLDATATSTATASALSNVLLFVTPRDAYGNAYTAFSDWFDVAFLLTDGTYSGALLPSTAAFKGIETSDGVTTTTTYYYYVEGSIQAAGSYTVQVAYGGTLLSALPTLAVAAADTAGVAFLSTVPDFVAGVAQTIYAQARALAPPLPFPFCPPSLSPPPPLSSPPRPLSPTCPPLLCPNLISPSLQAVDLYGNTVTSSTTDVFTLTYYLNGTAGVYTSAPVQMASVGMGVYSAAINISGVSVSGATLLLKGGLTVVLRATALSGTPAVWSAGCSVSLGSISVADTVVSLNGSTSTAQIGATTYVAGSFFKVVVLPVDAGGNVVTSGFSKIQAVIYPGTYVACTVASDGSGSYTANLATSLTVAGVYYVGVVVTVSSGSAVTVPGFNASVTVVAADVDYTKTMFVGTTFTAGTAATLRFYLRDASGNNITAGADSAGLSAQLSFAPTDPTASAAALAPSASSFTSPPYSLTFTPLLGGAAALVLSFTYNAGLSSVNLVTSNAATVGYYKFTVNAGVAVVANSFLFGRGIEAGASINVAATFYASLVDAYGNPVNVQDTSASTHFNWTSSSFTIISGTVTPSLDSGPIWDATNFVYSFGYYVAAAGTFSVNLTYVFATGGEQVIKRRNLAGTPTTSVLKAAAAPSTAVAAVCAVVHDGVSRMPFNASNAAGPLMSVAVGSSAAASVSLLIELAGTDGLPLASAAQPAPTALVSPTPTGTVAIVAAVSDGSPGRYALTFTSTVAQSYAVMVRLGGVPISAVPYAASGYVASAAADLVVNVVAGPAAGAKAVVRLRGGTKPLPPSLSMKAGSTLALIITSYDYYGNPRQWSSFLDDDFYSVVLKISTTTIYTATRVSLQVGSEF